MPRLIDANALIDWLTKPTGFIRNCDDCPDIDCVHCVIEDAIKTAPTVDAVEVVHGQRLYNAHEVAEIIAELFGDCCACNFNGIDEWLPLKCELQDACPFPVGVACWEQYLKYRSAKMDGDRDG